MTNFSHNNNEFNQRFEFCSTMQQKGFKCQSSAAIMSGLKAESHDANIELNVLSA